uniref:uncharacterized protein LOC120339644 n=1 Tax=Styela clava TaxID=7725 RepID=UPI00193A30E6|nr:uncharacterized protein LOC120339644 [Styela clava]
MKILCFLFLAAMISLSYSSKKDVVYVGDYELTYWAGGVDNVAFGSAAFLCSRQGRGDKLVKVNEADIYNAVQSILRDYGYPHTWGGGSDAMSSNYWQWIDETPMKSGFQKWNPGEPNSNGNENCLLMGWGAHYWNDVDCVYRYGYICQADESKITSSKYSAFTYSDEQIDASGRSMSFWEAQSQCMKQGSRLVEVDDENIYGIIRSKLEKLQTTKYWIGGTYKDIDGEWKRVETATDIGITKGIRKCVAIDNVGWNEYDCEDTSIQFICQTVQSYKLKISNENPVLVVSEKIQIDCNALGFPIPTVTWNKNKEPVSEDDGENIHQSVGEGSSSLVLNKAELSDEGQYECIAFNYVNGTKNKIRGFSNIKVYPYGTDLNNIDTDADGDNEWVEAYNDFMNRNNQSVIATTEPTDKDSVHDCSSESSDENWMIPTIIVLACLCLILLVALAFKSYISTSSRKPIPSEFTNNAVYAVETNGKA